MKILSFLLFLITSPLYAAEPAILQLHYDRAIEAIHPQHERLGIRIQINRPDGSPVPSARVHAQLKAPDTPWIASTDFPIVEGSLLFDSDVQIEGGAFNFAFVPPIRGTYTLTINVTPLPGDSSFAPTQQQWQTTIAENPKKQRNLTVLLFLLISIGGISGYIVARGPLTRKETLAALLPFLCLASTFMPQRLDAHGDEHEKHPSTSAATMETSEQGEKIELTLLTQEPRVGELATFTARLLNAEGQPEPARFRVRFTQLEHGIEVFSTEAVAPDGILRWNGQFYDGSDHRIDIEALPMAASFDERKPAHLEQTIAVEAISPPLKAVVKSLGFLLLVTAAAMFLGILLGIWRQRSEAHSS